jgi:hypothetical protein
MWKRWLLNWTVMLAFCLMAGHLAIYMDSWPSWFTTSQMLGNLASTSSTPTFQGRTNHCTEELLINFCELISEHSGENMAQAVFETLDLFVLKGWVLAIMANNASNNDTMCKALQVLCEKEGITFKAQWAWLQCMPHTTHLSAVAVWGL